MTQKTQNSLYRKLPLLTTIFVFVALILVKTVSGADRKKTIVLLDSMPVPVVLEHSGWFLDEMKVLGYSDMNMNLIRLNAQGDRQKARIFLEKALQEKRPDLVVTNATLASQEAMPILAKENIPQLFFTVGSPVNSGLIQELGKATGTNITGRAYSLSQSAKIENLWPFVEQLPLKRPIRFGIVYSSYPSSVNDVKALSFAAHSHDGIVFIPYMIPYRDVPAGIPSMLTDVKTAVEKLENEVDFWWQPIGPLGELSEYTTLLRTISSHITIFGTTLESVKNQGALLYMSPDREKYGRETARLAHRILTGTDPGSIPPTPPADFILAFNLKTALDLNIVVPSEIFKLAGIHIYK